jgi:hypothetical protein
MNPPDSPPGTPPSAPPPRSGPPRLVLVGVGLAVLGVVGLGAFLLGRGSAGSPPGGVGPGGMTQALPPPSDKQRRLDVPSEVQTPAFWVDVHAPGRVYQALSGNPWLKAQLDKPLGQGFVGGWAPFLGTRGEELGGAFKGAVLEVMAEQFLSSPFRVVWFSGPSRSGTPAIIVPGPSRTAGAAYGSLSEVSRRETLVASECPGGEGEVPPNGFELERWLLAEQALWAGRAKDRLVFARHPAAVLHGLCAPEVKQEAPQGVDVELGFSPHPLGREAQALAHVLGLGPDTRLQFAIEGQRLVGRGIAGKLLEEVRLDSAPLSDELLKLVPEETPVLLAFQLKLPERLEAETLKAFWSGKGARGPVRTRQVAVLWTPRGDAALPEEVALLWGRTEDEAALGEMFSTGMMVRSRACNHVVLASTKEVLEQVGAACGGRRPNLLNAASPVVEGLRAPGSVVFGVHTGRLLSGLLVDGHASQQQVDRKKPLPRSLPPEMEAARKDLETLPYVGLRGTVDGRTLVPGGFGS